MSLNVIELTPSGTPILIETEKLQFTQHGVTLELASGNGYPGQGFSTASASGTLFLTNRRVIYLPSQAQPLFKSLNVPLPNMDHTKLVQPWFSANKFECVVAPVPHGGLTLPANVTWVFKEGGAFEFDVLYKQLSTREQNDSAFEEELLPAYQ
ncbi:hypothetical protein HK101_002052 [Irineochytrium annulatum]|nr:hypothetical protein HK101_002052 [Irineochytrium annulatum]